MPLLARAVLALSCLYLVNASGSSLQAAPPQSEQVFRAGTAKVDISPWLGISLNGGMRDRAATEVHDKLHARALVLDNGETQLAIVVCDSCMIPRDIFDAAKSAAAKETGILPSHMLCSATHTHSAPSATGVFQSDEDPRYRKLLAKRIGDAIVQAHAKLQPARIGWGTGNAREHVHNRRWKMRPGTIPSGPFTGKSDAVKMNPPRASADLVEPVGPIDPVVSVISVQTAAGRPLCLLANYSLHYVGGTGGGHVSADYFGAFSERIAQRLIAEENGVSDTLGIMSNGTSGDINNIDFRKSRERKAPYEQIEYVAKSVAEEALKVYRTIEHKAWIPLAVEQEELSLKVRKPTKQDLAEAKQIVSEAEGPVMRSLAEVYARETLLLEAYPTEVELIVQAMRIGDLAIAAIPCEVFVEIGLELRQRSPMEHTFTISLSNGYNGYLPTPRQHKLGGYETWRARSSYLEENASPRITKSLVDMLESMSE